MKDVLAKTGREVPLAHTASNHCFGCGAANKTGLRLKFFTDESGRILSRVKVSKRFEGPPGHMHGGAIATLMDEAMSKANRARGVTAMTRHMEVEYLTACPARSSLAAGGSAHARGWTEAFLRGGIDERRGPGAGESEGRVSSDRPGASEAGSSNRRRFRQA